MKWVININLTKAKISENVIAEAIFGRRETAHQTQGIIKGIWDSLLVVLLFKHF